MHNFPKYIHQIWIQGADKIPAKFEKNIKKIIEYNPDWTHIIWDEDKIIELLTKTDQSLLETYHKLEYLHHKADYARYIIIYIYGGIYIDMDAYTIKSLNSLAEKYNDYDLLVSKVNTNPIENFLATWQTDILINNGVIMAKPNNHILSKIISSIVSEPLCEAYDNRYTCIQRVTGPKKFSRYIYNNLDNKVKILSYDYFEPCLLSYCNITPNTYIVHVHEGSWYSDSLKKVFQSYMYAKNNIFLILTTIFVIFGLFMLFKKNA
jgi:mannosyltransferase OCH1-like enzyme